jgi:hypothetical protein
LQLDAGTWKMVEDLLRDEIDVVVGALCSDGFTIEVEFVAGYGDFEYFLDRGVRPGHTIFIGRFPARANDNGAVTVVLPDLDGVTRRHPY